MYNERQKASEKDAKRSTKEPLLHHSLSFTQEAEHVMNLELRNMTIFIIIVTDYITKRFSVCIMVIMSTAK